MRDILTTNGDFVIPDPIAYDGDRQWLVYYPNDPHKSVKLTAAIGGDTLVSQITTTAVVAIDLTLYLRSLSAVGVQIYAQVTAEVVDLSDVTHTDTVDVSFWYYHGKTYTHRTHYAESAIYVPDDYGAINYIMPFNGVVSIGNNDTIGNEGEVIEVPVGDCDTTLHVSSETDLKHECIDDCGWSHGIDSVRVYGTNRNGNYEYYLLMPIPDTDHRWRVETIGTQHHGGYIDCPTLLMLNYGNMGNFSVDVYTAGGNYDYTATFQADGDHTATMAFNSGAIDYGTRTVGGVDCFLDTIVFGNSGGDILTVWGGWGPIIDTSTVTYGNTIGGWQTLLTYLTAAYDLHDIKCRHDYTPWSQGVLAVNFGPLARLVPTAELYRWQLVYFDNTRKEGDSIYYDGDFTSFAVNTDGYAIILSNDYHLSATTIVMYTAVPNCKGYYSTNVQPSHLDVQSVVLSTTDVSVRMVELGGNLTLRYAMYYDNVVTYAQIFERWDREDGVWRSIYEVGQSIVWGEGTWIAKKVCCGEPPIIVRGEIGSESEQSEWDVKILRGCFTPDQKGVWLHYYNADGAERWLPGHIIEIETSGEPSALPNSWQYGNPFTLGELNRAVTQHSTGVDVVLSVAFTDIDEGVYIEDVLAGDVCELWDSDLITMRNVLVVDNAIVREDYKRDYLLKLKCLTK